MEITLPGPPEFSFAPALEHSAELAARKGKPFERFLLYDPQDGTELKPRYE